MAKKSRESKKLIKIMYFDEQAAVDALEIIDGGSALDVINKSLEKGNFSGVSAGAGKSFMGFLQFGLKGNAKREKNTIVQSKVTSTLISKFIDGVTNGSINLIETNAPKLNIQKESNAYYRDLLPMTLVVKDISAIDVDADTKAVFKGLDFDKMGTMLDSLSAYYELEGVYEKKRAIYRFNIDGLRNNYTLLDLEKVTNMRVYGLIVGKSKTMDLSFNKNMDSLINESTQVPVDFQEMIDKKVNASGEANEYPIIDVILAGIES